MLEDLKKLFRGNNLVVQIIVINAAIFVVFNLLENFPLMRTFTRDWMALPSDLGRFATRPWTLTTYMFFHGGLSHILYNMLTFYWFGRIFSDFLGTKRLWGLYFLGGLAGGVFYVVVYNLTNPDAVMSIPLVGASAAVMAVVVASGLRFPDYQMNLLFFGPVQLRWIALALFVLSTVLDLSQNFGGKMAHLGGAAVGFAYVRFLDKGTDFALGFNEGMRKLWSRILSFRRRKSPLTASRGGAAPVNRPASGTLTKDEVQRKTDLILDKISKTGYDNLSKEEKDFLFRVSNRHS